jgi:UPF0716 family protein affecting phage T7 exclusion
MALSAREQQILDEIERGLTARSPLRGRVQARLGLGYRGQATQWRRVTWGSAGWMAAMSAGLLAGIALLTAGLFLWIPGMIIGGGALTQLSPVTVAWLGRRSRRAALRGRPADQPATRRPPGLFASRKRFRSRGILRGRASRPRAGS